MTNTTSLVYFAIAGGLLYLAYSKGNSSTASGTPSGPPAKYVPVSSPVITEIDDSALNALRNRKEVGHPVLNVPTIDVRYMLDTYAPIEFTRRHR